MCIKCVEALSFDSPAEIDVVRRFSMFAKGFVSASAGAQTRDLRKETTRSSHSAIEAPTGLGAKRLSSFLEHS